MIIKDRVHGKITIKSKVIEDLILSAPFQRLKKVSQDGAVHFIQPNRNVTRYEHSIGVWYLSKLYKRPIEEQIACLLHDLPHTAFSHVIDFVFPNKNHDFHEKFTKKIILDSEIPNILKSHKISLKKVLEVEKFKLLGNNLPDISFDRWDYFMRDGQMMRYLPKSVIKVFLKNMFINKHTQIYFKDISIASLYTILFTSFSRLIWLDPTSHGSYFLLSNILKVAIKKNIITEQEFFTDDTHLTEILFKSPDKEIKILRERLKINKNFVYAPKEQAEFFGPNKPRSVDPIVILDGKFERLSKVVDSIDYFIQEFKQNYKNIGVIQQ